MRESGDAPGTLPYFEPAVIPQFKGDACRPFRAPLVPIQCPGGRKENSPGWSGTGTPGFGAEGEAPKGRQSWLMPAVTEGNSPYLATRLTLQRGV